MRGGQVVIGVVAARLLVPKDFGLFAVTIIVYAIVVNVSDFGVASALIRSRMDLDKIAPTAVTLSLISAACMAAAMYAASPWITAELGAPGARGPVQIMSLVVLIAGLSAVPTALLTRGFMQNRRFYADLSSFVVSNGLLVVLAIQGHGVYALAWSRVAGQVVTVAVLFMLSPRVYHPGFQRSVARILIRFGLPMVGANLLGFAIGAVDVAVIGRLLGPIPLGSYSLANNAAGWPLQLFLPVLINVGLPLIARFQTDRASLRSVVNTLMGAAALIFLPISALLVALAPSVVGVLYGSKWAAAGPVLAVLAVYGAIRVILALLSDVLIACDAPHGLMYIQAFWLVVLIPAVVVGAHVGGLVGASTAVVVAAAAAALPLSLVLVQRYCDVRALVLVRTILPPLVHSIVAAVVAWLVSGLFSQSWIVVSVGGLAGLLVYIALAHRSLRPLPTRLRIMLRQNESPDPDSRQDALAAIETAPLSQKIGELV